MRDLKESNVSLKDVVKDYFYDYNRTRNVKIYIAGLIFIALVIIDIGLISKRVEDMLMITPILFTTLNGLMHRITLPDMMYIIPYSNEWREKYIQKMLYIKIAVPVFLTIIIDVILIVNGNVPAYNLFFQIVNVFITAYITGTLYDGSFDGQDKKKAFGSMKDYVGIPLSICYIYSFCNCEICIDEISNIEFYVVSVFVGIVFIPIILMIRKRWKNIRRNFADFEIATKMGVK